MANLQTFVLKKLQSYEAHFQSVIKGLEGQPEGWSEEKRKRVEKALAKVGFTLITRNRAHKQGYNLADDAKPVGQGYYPAPIAHYCDMYILECHFVKSARQPAAEKAPAIDRYDEKAQALGYPTWRDMMIDVYEGRASVTKVQS